MNTKVCSVCNIKKELSEYYAQNKKKSNGEQYIYYFPYCKECTSKKAIENYESNREENLEYRKLHYHSNKEHYREKQRESDKRNREQRRNYIRNWQEQHPDKVKEYNMYREMNKKHEITLEEWENCKNYFLYRCAYCGLKIEEHLVIYNGKTILGDFHKEHVDHNGDNDLSNCIPACKSCNGQKNTIPFFEWYSSDNEKFDSNRFDTILKWLTEDYKLYIR